MVIPINILSTTVLSDTMHMHCIMAVIMVFLQEQEDGQATTIIATYRGVDADMSPACSMLTYSPAWTRRRASTGHWLPSHIYPNIEEAPSFISQQCQAAGQHTITTTADPHNLPGEAAASVHHCPAAPLSYLYIIEKSKIDSAKDVVHQVQLFEASASQLHRVL